MEQTITLRAFSMKRLDKKLLSYKNEGWKVKSTSKNPRVAKIFNTFKWTVVLMQDKAVEKTETAEKAE